jgi:hypothetical protein
VRCRPHPNREFGYSNRQFDWTYCGFGCPAVLSVLMTAPAHPGVKALRVIGGDLERGARPAAVRQEQLAVALSAAQAWLEDAAVQIHNSRSILQRVIDLERGTVTGHVAIAELCQSIDTIAAELHRTVAAVERVRGDAGTGGST